MKIQIIFLFAAFTSCIVQSQTLQEVKTNIFKAISDERTIQYDVKDTTYDSIREDSSCSESRIVERIKDKDPIVGSYYYWTDYTNVFIYSGNEIFEYYPSLYGEANVVYLTLRKNPAMFSDRPMKFKDHTGYVPGKPKSTATYNICFSTIKKILSEKYGSLRVSDSVFDGTNCIFITDDLNKIFINKKTYLPVFAILNNHTNLTRHVSYNNVVELKKASDKFFSKKAFPKKYSFKSNFKFIERMLQPGIEAPDFKLSSINEDTVTLSQNKDKVRLLYISEIGCPGCVMSLPEIKKLNQNFPDLMIIGIYPIESKKLLQNHASKENIKFTLCYKNNVIQKIYKTQGFPSFVLIDKKGIIRYSELGYSAAVINQINEKIKALLKE